MRPPIDPARLSRVQCGHETYRFQRDRSELARMVARNRDWLTDGQAVYDSNGNRLARSFEDAAAAMVELQWIILPHQIYWSTIDASTPSAEEALAARLDEEGQHPTVRRG